MIVSSILFFSAFTFIQLNNQVNMITRFNSYKANLSIIIVKNNLETMLKKAADADPKPYLQANLGALKGSEIFEDALIFDKEGQIIAATNKEMIGSSISYKELSKWQDLEYLLTQDKWFAPEVDKLKQRLNMFLAIKSPSDAQLIYVAKVTFSLGNIQQALADVYNPVIGSAIIILLLNLLLGYLLSKTVIGPIRILNNVTKIIASGDLSIRTNIHTNDELQELGETFNFMTVELIKMKERAENANPLTKLPGNIVIHEQVEQRIQSNQKFVVIYCDLDNFKAFNDKYGIAKGDEAIKITADVFKEAVKAAGSALDFIGHEGGDDFILLTTPAKADAVAEYIIKEFASRIRSLYSQEDLQAGFIIAHARDGSINKFPIMTISLAGVSNEFKPITSYAEVTNIAADLKKKAKATGGSVFVIDKRGV
jgi:diguanylate cyclase (GGDEF)-like protein